MDRVVRDDVEQEFNARLERHESIDTLEKRIEPGKPDPEIVVSMKLRRVLLLQNGTEAGREDILVARINSISEAKRARDNWYKKLHNDIHPVFYLVGREERHGMNDKEAYVDTLTVSPIRKATILRRVGELDEDEMREVSERLVRALEFDLSRYARGLTPEG